MSAADEFAALQLEIADLCRKADAAGFVVLRLKCCCCGQVVDELPTPWPSRIVRAESIWLREPCSHCQLYFATHGDWPVD